MRILVIGDSHNTTQPLEAMFRAEKYIVDGIDWLDDMEVVQMYDYSIIILDVPDAEETVSRIRKTKISTPIIVLSYAADVASIVNSLFFGADDYLTKPFDKRELIARIHAIVRRYKRLIRPDPQERGFLSTKSA